MPAIEGERSAADAPLNLSPGYQRERVTFTSGGVELVGNLYVPEDLAGPAPAVPLLGPELFVKEQAPMQYAKRRSSGIGSHTSAASTSPSARPAVASSHPAWRNWMRDSGRLRSSSAAALATSPRAMPVWIPTTTVARWRPATR